MRWAGLNNPLKPCRFHKIEFHKCSGDNVFMGLTFTFTLTLELQVFEKRHFLTVHVVSVSSAQLVVL